MRRILAAALALLLLLFASCQGRLTKPEGLDLSGFQDENGHFNPQNAAWKAPVTEVERSLGEALGEFKNLDDTTEKTNGHYIAHNKVSWDEHTGAVIHEIRNGVLVGVSYVFQDADKDLDGLYDSIRAKLTEYYGEPYFSGDTLDGHKYQWLTENTDSATDIRASTIGVGKNIVNGKSAEVHILLGFVPWET